MNRLTFKRRWTLLAIALLILLSTFATGGERQHRPNNDQAIAAEALPLDPRSPARTELGQLRFLGAWALTSENDRFGGISGLIALPDKHFIAIGDAGTVIGFGLGRDARIVDPFIRPLPWRGNQEKEPEFEERDSEAGLRDPQTGKFWVSFENHPSLRRYSADFTKEERTLRPKAMKAWPTNSGAESLARLNDGRFLILSEGGKGPDGSYEALLYPRAPESGMRPIRFGYRPPDGFKATDADVLPDGRVVILHRRLAFPSGLSASIGIADPADIRPGKVWQATELARLESPLAVDNMEGLAVTQEDGRDIVWIISDDNFNAFQRTLLMKFALPGLRADRGGAPGFESLSD